MRKTYRIRQSARGYVCGETCVWKYKCWYLVHGEDIILQAYVGHALCWL